MTHQQSSTSAPFPGACSAAELEERLYEIVRALDGRQVGANAEEFWFRSNFGDELEIRLGWNLDGRCYGRSMNFAISYGAGPSETAAVPSDHVIDRIRSIDDTSLGDVASVFGVAAGNVVKRFSDNAEDRAAGSGNDATGRVLEIVANEGASFDSDPSATVGGVLPEPDPRWERVQTRKLNIVFLDMCAQLMSGQNQALSPLHWGFWPADAESAPAVAADYDPFWAFSENLLAYIPQGACRVMDVGCGLGANTRLLAERNLRVTAVTPVAHHRDLIEQAKLPGVDARCVRFEEMQPEERYDLLLFSESVNHFPLTDEFLEHCKIFLERPGFMLIADDLTEERACRVEEQQIFRVLRAVDISKNVAPTCQWWVTQKRAIAAYGTALMSILEMHDPPVAARVRQILDELDSDELRVLFSEEESIPVSKGRYMIYLLQPR